MLQAISTLRIKSASFMHYQRRQNTKLTHKITEASISCACLKMKHLEADQLAAKMLHQLWRQLIDKPVIQ